MPRFKNVFFAFALSFILVGVTAQEAEENKIEDESAVNVEIINSNEKNGTTLGSSENISMEEMSDEEYEASLENSKSNVTVNFVFGDIVWLDRYRAKNFYPDLLGWWPEILLLLGVNVPSGIDNMRLEFSGMAINDHPTSVTLAWGGGIQTKSFSGGKDARHFKYTEHQDFWSQQDRLKDKGQKYVERNYETAFAWWKLQWDQRIVLPDPTNWMNFNLGYTGLYRKWLSDLGVYGRSLDYYLPKTDLADKDQYILNTIYSGISVGKTEYPDVPFTHGLMTSIGSSFRFEIAPWFMNMHLDDLAGVTNGNRDNWIFLKDYNGRQVSDYYGAFVMIPRKTADYYKVKWDVYGNRGLWDIAPERKSNWFSGRLDWDFSVSWFDKIGDAGYIPLEVRGDYARRLSTWASFRLVMNLPSISIADLKGWSTPKANVEFEKIEESFANFLNFFGFQVDDQSWSNYNFITSELRTSLNTNYTAEVDPNNERTYMIYYDQRSAFDMYINVRFGVRIMQIFTLGFESNLNIPGRWASGWVVFDL